MKKHLTKKKVFFSALAVIIIIIFAKFLSLLSFPDSAVVLEKGNLIPLTAKSTLTQTFVANRSNLETIQFLFRTPGPKPASTVSVEIADESCTKTLRKGTLTMSFLNSGNLFEFSFAKIPDSIGKRYCLLVTTSAKNLRLFSMPESDQQFGLKNITTGETFEGQTLSIRGVYVNENLGQDLRELSQRISQYKPWFLKHYFLETIGILFVILSVGLIVVLIVA